MHSNLNMLALIGLVVLAGSANFVDGNFASGNREVILNGQCDNVEAVDSFIQSEFVGDWNVIEAYPDIINDDGNCGELEFTTSSTSSMSVTYSHVDSNVAKVSTYASWSQINDTAEFNMFFGFSNENSTVSFLENVVKILAVDYSSYALVHSCMNLTPETKAVKSWKLSRTRVLTDAANTAINNIISQVSELDSQYYQTISHTTASCFYYPTFDPNTVTNFIGVCNADLPVVNNFILNNFAGEWHEISTYPRGIPETNCRKQNFNFGTGNTITYEENVDNEVVTTQYQLVQTGNEAKFTFDIEINGNVVTVPFWIIGTDYNNYALAYGCIQTEENRRQVFSWKLGRTNTLSETSNSAIAQAMASVDVLDERYFIEVDHSFDSCYVLPEFVEGQEIIMDGQCDETIQAVPNFNMNLFTGKWIVRENYHDDKIGGECADVTYSFDSETNIMTIISTHVNNNSRLITDIATATPQFDDGSGKFVLVDSSEDSDVISFRVIPYWILATDYLNYALAYSCENITPTTRRVNAWKLIRSLRGVANVDNAFEFAMSNIMVLNQKLFFARNHTTEACFYMPDPVAGEPVVFRRICGDNDIPVVENFDYERYSGTWYEISRYPSPVQPGECSINEYTYNTENEYEIDVYTTSVANRTLMSAHGLIQNNFVNGTTGSLQIGYPDVDFPDIIYYVVSTDYNNYALVYSCRNIDTEYSVVNVWKLGRSTAALSQASNQAIAEAMVDIDVMDEQYFEDISFTEDSCFYYPDSEFLQLEGACDESIAGITNFDSERFAGSWFEHSSYLFGSDRRFCVSHNFTAQNNDFNISSYQIVKLAEIESYGTLIKRTGDEAVFDMSINYENDVLSAPVKVLSTDYDNYALLYSCVNLPTGMRSIYSWKLSRDTELSEESQNTIANVMEPLIDLDERFYFETGHDEEACYVLPDLVPGQYYDVYGQCESSGVLEVEDLSYEQFSGIWYELESYYDGRERNCSWITYSTTNNVTSLVNQYVANDSQLQLIGSFQNEDQVLVIVQEDEQFALNFNHLNHRVVATDYESYALVHYCYNVAHNIKRIFSQKLSRTMEFSETAVNAINDAIAQVEELDNNFYLPIVNSEEFCDAVIPEYTEGDTLIFRGQCSDIDHVFENFDVARYQGPWYYIESTTDERAQGDCNDAEFVVNTDGSLTGLFSNVKDNQWLSSQGLFEFINGTGQAVVNFAGESNDNTISFTDYNYWVLDTDYTNYALVFTCVDLTFSTKVVTAHKMSRTRDLRDEHRAAIDDVIEDFLYLNNDYFSVKQHTFESCLVKPDLVSGQDVIFRGFCDPSVEAVADFDGAQFSGVWYNLESYHEPRFSGDCQDLSIDASGSRYILNSTYVNNENLVTVNAGGNLINGVFDGVIAATLPDGDIQFLEDFSYKIIATDYTTYSLVYSCRNITRNTMQVFSAKWSRTSTGFSAQANTNLNQAINANVLLDQEYFVENSYSSEACFYFPVNRPGIPVTFRGQCDESVNVVQNFDVARYMGTWYDIASYPELFQFGSCPTATYTLLSDGTVEVYNTQVVNSQLDDIYGSAVLDSTDGSAKLLVSFPIAGTNFTASAPYWVLSTDYDNYALVYSCNNIDSQNKRVTAWKLSREWTLSEPSSNAIDQAMQEVKVVDDRYFTSRGHDEEACFWYPEIPTGQPIIVDGQCSDVQAVPNFLPSSISRVWFEHKRYWHEGQSGACDKFEFVNDATGFHLNKNAVVNEQLINVRYNLTQASDMSGSLTATYFDASGESVTENLYVLASDSSYLILYSCKNIQSNPPRRQLYSWQLGTFENGFVGNTATEVNNFVENTNILFAPYYEDTAHNSDVCFFYPEITDSTTTITMSGLCPVLSGIPNFNLEAFSGEWFTVANYPNPRLDVNCPAADFRYNESSVEVHYSSVSEQKLIPQSFMGGLSSIDNSGAFAFRYVNTLGIEVEQNVLVLDTDYNNYALLYTCYNLRNEVIEVVSWKLSRTHTLDSQSEAAMATVIANTRTLREEYFRDNEVSVDDCFYIPDIVPGELVVFRGQCDENISGVQGFNAQRFAGWWHDAEMYPDGKDEYCHSTEITQVGNQFVVTDTTVSGLTANIVTSTAEISNNGRIRKTANGVTTDVWVLATDYDTYALTYSCENINAVYKRVTSSKQTKSKVLTNSAQAAMQNVIANVNVLVPEFFVAVDQSTEACFHYPAPNNEKIILPGQCDSSIRAEANFNLANYAGTWYEIEKYPDGRSTSCSGRRYTFNEATNTLSVLQWENINGELETRTGNMYSISTDGSARLLVEMQGEEEGQSTMSELMVLGTNYGNYSLVYSCQNVNEFQREVSVWKLSKQKYISNIWNTVINNFIEEREELHEPYFVTVNQGDDCLEPSSGLIVKSSIILMLVCAMLQRLFT